MPIKAKQIQTWNVEPLQYKQNKYPTSAADLPKFYWVGLFVGARQSGKTYTLCKLLKHYEEAGVFDSDGKPMSQRIIIFSPTVDANPCFSTLKNLDPSDIHNTYSDEALREVVDDIKAEKEATEKYKEDLQLWRKYCQVKDIDALSDWEIMQISSWNYEKPEPPRFPNGVVNFLILDDLVGTSALRQGRSALTYLAIRNRHLQINLAILVQGMRQIPKIIRTNANVFAIWKFANKKMILDDLYEEVSNCLKPEEFEELYEYCTQDQHDCMVLDFSKPREEIVRRSFKEIVNLCHI